MRLFRSIRARFTAWYLLVLAVLLVLMSAGLYFFVGRTLYGSVDDGLIHRASQLASMRDIPARIAEGRFEAALGEVLGFYVRAEEGFQITSTHVVEDVLEIEWIEEAFRGGQRFVTVTSSGGQDLRFYITRFLPRPPVDVAASQTPGAPQGDLPLSRDAAAGELPDEAPETIEAPVPTVVVIAQPLDRIASALATLRATLLIAVPLTLLLSAGGGLFLVRRALQPVDRMIAAARDIEETDLSRRVSAQADDELGRLARTLNAMLDRLERAFRRQRQFTDDASHELRGPLSVIEAEATLALRREREAEDYREVIATIAEESRTMNRLIDQLLTLARSDAGEEPMDVEPLDLLELASETVGTLRPVADEKGVRLVCEGTAAVAIEGDPIRLRRVIANLVENAIRHTPADGTVVVRTQAESTHAVIVVADTGSGIPEAHLPHVFERFYRVDRARSRSEGGSGLGLAICKAIVEAHQGRIDVESQEGEGARFTVHLPLRRGSRAG